MDEKEDLDCEITYQVNAVWINGKIMTELLCDMRMSPRMKGTIFNMVVKPAMIYGAKTRPIKKAQLIRLEVAKTTMFLVEVSRKLT